MPVETTMATSPKYHRALPPSIRNTLHSHETGRRREAEHLHWRKTMSVIMKTMWQWNWQVGSSISHERTEEDSRLEGNTFRKANLLRSFPSLKKFSPGCASWATPLHAPLPLPSVIFTNYSPNNDTPPTTIALSPELNSLMISYNLPSRAITEDQRPPLPLGRT